MMMNTAFTDTSGQQMRYGEYEEVVLVRASSIDSVEHVDVMRMNEEPNVVVMDRS